jgi:hypothetical protein
MHDESSTHDNPPGWAIRREVRAAGQWSMTVDVVGLAADPDRQDLQALVVTRRKPPFEGQEGWPGGLVDPETDRDPLQRALLELHEETGQAGPEYVEELHAYDAYGRDPRQFAGYPDPETGTWIATGTRVVSKAYLAVFRKPRPGLRTSRWAFDALGAHWLSVYAYLPWEDLRSRTSRATRGRLLRGLREWAKSLGRTSAHEQIERIDTLFSIEAWNEEQVDERWRLLLQARLVEEALRDRWGRVPEKPAIPPAGRPLAFDHRTMLADALAALRRMIKDRPKIVQAIVGDDFRLSELQAAFEAVGGRPLYRANFRRALTAASSAVLAPTGEKLRMPGPGKPADLFRVRENLPDYRLEQPLNLPWSRDPEP